MRLRSLAAASALIVAIPVAVLATNQAAASAAPDPALTGAPKAGQCYDLSDKQSAATSTSAAAVPCTQSHTLWIYRVAKVDSSLDLTDSTDLATAVNQACTSSTTKHAIGNLELPFAKSAYTFAHFAPTKDDIAAGAHWISCEAGLFGGKNKLAVTKIKKLVKTTDKKLPDAFQLCGSRTYYLTNCADKHSFRSTYAFWVNGKYSTTKATKAAQKTCPKHVKRNNPFLYSSRVIYSSKFSITCLGSDKK
jgi:hypothetical protein